MRSSNPTLRESAFRQDGVALDRSNLMTVDGAMTKLAILLLLVVGGAAMTWNMTVRYLEGLSRVFDGGVGADQISGPIGIARIARHSLDRGFEEYLFWIMLISINLGILNLLPIPILDGGQALIYSIEGIMRSPLSMRAREMANSFGFAVLVLLMGRAFWNDLTPFWSRFVDWLSGSAP